MKSYIEKFKVDAEIGVNAAGEPTFNGRSRKYIVEQCYTNINYYQMASKPRLLVESENDD